MYIYKIYGSQIGSLTGKKKRQKKNRKDSRLQQLSGKNSCPKVEDNVF